MGIPYHSILLVCYVARSYFGSLLAARALKISDPGSDSHAVDVCSHRHRLKYRRKCCNARIQLDPAASEDTVTPEMPPYEGLVGDEPNCPICRTPEYPGKPDEIIMARYVGVYSCGQLFQMGYHGMISRTMCGPLQDFAYSVCGCGIYNPACKNNQDKCWGGSEYEPPYIIPIEYSSTSASIVQDNENGNLQETDDGPIQV